MRFYWADEFRDFLPKLLVPLASCLVRWLVPGGTLLPHVPTGLGPTTCPCLGSHPCSRAASSSARACSSSPSRYCKPSSASLRRTCRCTVGLKRSGLRTQIRSEEPQRSCASSRSEKSQPSCALRTNGFDWITSGCALRSTGMESRPTRAKHRSRHPPRSHHRLRRHIEAAGARAAARALRWRRAQPRVGRTPTARWRPTSSAVSC